MSNKVPVYNRLEVGDVVDTYGYRETLRRMGR